MDFLKKIFTQTETKREGSVRWTKEDLAKARKVNNEKKQSNIWDIVHAQGNR